MHQLFELFAPNMLSRAINKRYKQGDIFTLVNNVAVIIEGVIAIDVITPQADNLSTLRLATLGDTLNLERVIRQPVVAKQYVVESPTAVVSLIPVGSLEDDLRSQSVELQNILTQNILSQVLKSSDDITETVTAVGNGNAYDQVFWAIKRLCRVFNTNKVAVKNDRLAAHTGIRPETVSRAISQLCDDGKLYRNPTLKMLEMRA